MGWRSEDLPELVRFGFHDWACGKTEDCRNFESLEVRMVEVLHDAVRWVVSDAVVSCVE